MEKKMLLRGTPSLSEYRLYTDNIDTRMTFQRGGNKRCYDGWGGCGIPSRCLRGTFPLLIFGENMQFYAI